MKLHSENSESFVEKSVEILKDGHIIRNTWTDPIIKILKLVFFSRLSGASMGLTVSSLSLKGKGDINSGSSDLSLNFLTSTRSI